MNLLTNRIIGSIFSKHCFREWCIMQTHNVGEIKPKEYYIVNVQVDLIELILHLFYFACSKAKKTAQ